MDAMEPLYRIASIWFDPISWQTTVTVTMCNGRQVAAQVGDDEILTMQRNQGNLPDLTDRVLASWNPAAVGM